ncbi:MAG: TIGR03545 family protein [Desulfobacteraceae bacterium]|nr:TIGR03545 family protein [Desulfobacteraceae bacterium]
MKKTFFTVIAVIILFVFIFWVFVVDLVAEKYIEKQGTKAVGARVELASVDISIFPAGVECFDLKVTNPKKPMENSVQIDHIQTIMEILPLLQRKVIINDIIFDKVKLNTKREKSGALDGRKTALPDKEHEKPEWLKEICQQGGMNLFETPDIKQILKKEYESLESVKLSKGLQKNLSEAQEKYTKKLNNLADKEKIENYKIRINKIKDTDSSSFAILGSVAESRQLYKEIEDDLDDIQDVKKQFKTELKKYEKDLKNISKTLSKDVNNLTNKYSSLKSGTIEFSKLLFGQSLCTLFEKYSKWFALAEPYFKFPGKEGDTKDSEKPSKTNKPAKSGKEVYFIAQNIKINLLLGNGSLTGKASNITNMPEISKLPAIINFSGGGFQGLKSFDFKGVMDLIDSAHPHHKANLDVKGFMLENFIFSDEPDLSLSLIKSITNFASSFQLDDNKFKWLANAKFDEVVMKAASLKGSSLQKAMVKTLSDIDKFNLLFDMNGSEDKYDVAIKSDLDKLFQGLVQKMVKSKTSNFQKELKTGIRSKNAKSNKQNKQSLADFNKIGSQLSQRSAQSNALLNEIY